jgi:hypothetical protein
LHNWLLEIDGLDVRWEDGISSDWERELGQHDCFDETTDNNIDNGALPDAIRRLIAPVASRTYDLSSMGRGNDRVDSSLDDMDEAAVEDPAPHELPPIDEDGVTNVRDLSLDYFRRKLITHFDIAFQRGEVIWPRRTGRPNPIDI